MEWYLLHPAAVHFPIVLLILGWAAAGLTLFSSDSSSPIRSSFAAQAASWLLGLGTLCAWAAMAMGLLAEKTAPHVPLAWRTLREHKLLAFWTVGVFTALALWRWKFGGKSQKLQFLVWTVGLGLLLATAYHGGELVFTYGMGVAAASDQ